MQVLRPLNPKMVSMNCDVVGKEMYNVAGLKYLPTSSCIQRFSHVNVIVRSSKGATSFCAVAVLFLVVCIAVLCVAIG